MKCPNCGAHIEKTDKRCPYCNAYNEYYEEKQEQTITVSTEKDDELTQTEKDNMLVKKFFLIFITAIIPAGILIAILFIIIAAIV